MSRASRTRRWHDQHSSDPFVKKAREAGLRSRATFKLGEIDVRDRLLKPGMAVLDLGAAPGGWSQYARDRVGPAGVVVAVDRLEMPEIAGVHFVHGDLNDAAVAQAIGEAMAGRRAGLVMSDMAPNLSGVKSRDQAEGEWLGELAVSVVDECLGEDGSLVIKTFHGRGFEVVRGLLRERFIQVVVRKPAASRDRSSEVYLVGKGYRA